jgi:hypothetical protein
MKEQIEKFKGASEMVERGLKWLEQNEKYMNGVSVWDEMNSSRPNVNTIYVAWNGGYGEDSALVVEFHNGLGDDAMIDSIKIVSTESAKELISHCSDPLPTVNTVEWLKRTLETEREKRGE